MNEKEALCKVIKNIEPHLYNDCAKSLQGLVDTGVSTALKNLFNLIKTRNILDWDHQ